MAESKVTHHVLSWDDDDMTPKERAAMQQALDALEVHQPDPEQQMVTEAITALREALAEQAEQEPFDMDDHPPHRLCECRKCMEYFTPLPDCDAFAASGKPIAEQEPVVKYPGCDYCNDELFCGRKCKCCGKVFIEDEDFVQSEVKNLRQQVAALKAVLDAWNNVEQEPVAWHHPQCEGQCIACLIEKAVQDAYGTQGRDYMLRHINAAPVRTKDLTDDEISKLRHKIDWTAEWSYVNFARAVIQADREKNK